MIVAWKRFSGSNFWFVEKYLWPFSRHLHNNQIQSMGARCFEGLHSLETLWVSLSRTCRHTDLITHNNHTCTYFLDNGYCYKLYVRHFRNLAILRTRTHTHACTLKWFHRPKWVPPLFPQTLAQALWWQSISKYQHSFSVVVFTTITKP